MSLLEEVAVTDLKLRLIVGPAVIAFACSVFAGVQLFGAGSGLAVGLVVGLALAAGVAYGIGKLVV